MSLSDNKRKVFTTIGSYTSFIQENKPTKNYLDMFKSINNKKDVVPYLLDVLKTVAGTEALKELIGGMLTKLVVSAETKVKVALKKQFTQFNADDDIPSEYAADGIVVKVKDIDIKGKLKVDPASDSGQLIYKKGVDSFDKIAHNALNTGTDVSFAGMNMSVKYEEKIDSFRIKLPTTVKVGEFFNNYIDKAEIINKDELVTTVMDTIYGVFSKKNNKTPEQVLNDLKVQKILEQVINDDANLFTLLPKDYDDLQKQASDLANGVTYYDMGCGLMQVQLPFSGLTSLIKTISGSTDPFVVSNAVEDALDKSNAGSPETSAENKETIRDGFFQKLINLFTTQLLQFSVAAPQIRVLMGIIGALINKGEVLIGNAVDDMKKFAIMIKCMAKEILKMIAEFIFNLAVSYLIKLLTPVIKKVLKEKINQYANIIKSLTPISKLLNST